MYIAAWSMRGGFGMRICLLLLRAPPGMPWLCSPWQAQSSNTARTLLQQVLWAMVAAAASKSCKLAKSGFQQTHLAAWGSELGAASAALMWQL